MATLVLPPIFIQDQKISMGYLNPRVPQHGPRFVQHMGSDSATFRPGGGREVDWLRQNSFGNLAGIVAPC